MSPKKYSITCSIVLYKSEKEEVQRAIKSFLNTVLPIKLYLVDNSPTDELKILADSEKIEYIFNNKNIGYGAAHNKAIIKSVEESKYHIVLNPDVYFESGVLEKLHDFMEKNQEIGHIMPQVLYPNGEIQYLCKLLPTPIDLILRMFVPKRFFKEHRKRFDLQDFGYNTIMEVPFLSGCFIFMRTKAFQDVGMFDERFFMYAEDIDLTRRIHAHYKTIFYPHTSIFHRHEKASKKSMKMFWIHTLNIIKYFNKWGWFFDKERRQINKRILSQFEKDYTNLKSPQKNI